MALRRRFLVVALALIVGVLAGAASARAGSLLYGINTGTDTLFTVDTGTGVVSTIGGLGVSWGFGGLDFYGSNLYAINQATASLYSINSATGLATLIGATGVVGAPLESFAIVGGVGYTQNVITQDLYSINLTTGAAALIGGYAGGAVTGLTSDGTSLYGTRISEMDLVQLNIATGALASVIGVHGLSGDTSLAYAQGAFWTIPAASGRLYSLNLLTASPTLQFVGLPLSHVTALTAAPIPEPATLLLLGTGLAAAGVRRRMKKRG